MSTPIRIREQTGRGNILPIFKTGALLSTPMINLINTQIKNEFYSSYLYLSMAGWCRDRSLNGMGHWLEKQFEEEKEHGFKFYEYLYKRNGKVALQTVDAPPSEFTTPLDLWQQVYNHEILVSELLYKIVLLSEQEKDHTTFQIMQWFISEQIEEVNNSYDVVQRLTISGDNAAALLQIDFELGKR